MKVVAVANRKGGTGKTTTVVNLANEWAAKGYKTLVIDLDTQGHAAIGLGCPGPFAVEKTIHQIYRDQNLSLDAIVHPTPVENVFLAPADILFMMQSLDELRLRNALHTPSNQTLYDRVVIDTPPTLDGLLYNGLVAADGVLVPFVPHHLAEVGVKQLARLFYQVATQHNADLKLLGLLPIMYDRKMKLHQRVIDALKKQFGAKRLMRGIRSNIRLAEAFEQGKPVKQFAQKSVGAFDYHLMVEELESFLTE